jgi:hypothetical protein
LLLLTSAVVPLAALNIPITVIPSRVTVGEGVPVRLDVAQLPHGFTSLQWLRNGAPIPGATNYGFYSTLRLTNTAFTDAGVYTLQATNQFGEVRSSSAADVRVVPSVQLRRVASIRFARGLINLDVRGQHAFIAAQGLSIYDLSDRANPVLVSRYASALGDIYDVAVQGNLALAIGGIGDESFIELLDVENPGQPISLSQLKTHTSMRAVTLDRPLAYIAGDVFQVWNIADARHPALLGQCQIPQAFTMKMAGDVAYLASYNAGLQVVDILNPAAPSLLQTIDERLGLFDSTGLSGDRLYCSGDRLRIYDASDRRAPRLLSNTQRLFGLGPRDNALLCQGSFVFAGNGSPNAQPRTFLSVFDAADPENVIEVGRYPIETAEPGIHDAQMEGSCFYLAGPDVVEIVEWLPAAHPPVIVADVGDKLAVAGTTVALQARATGGEHLAFQWFRGPEELARETNAILRLPASSATAGEYRVRVTNSAGFVESSGAVQLTEPLEFSAAISYEGAPRIRFQIPAGFQCALEGSVNLKNWHVVWQGEGRNEAIEVSPEETDPFHFFRLRYGSGAE